MAGQTVGRGRGNWVGIVVGACVVGAAAPLAAQVGYPPNASPYHDTPHGPTIDITFGYLGGSRGSVGVGPSNGGVFSFRYELPLSSSLGTSIGVTDAFASRFLVDPTQDSLTRRSGPVASNLAMIDLGIHLVVTGAKSWHGLVPIVGAFIGLAVSPRQTQDTSQYAFSTKAVLGPELALRWYVSRTLSLRADARVAWWRLSYPLEYKDPAPDGSRVLGVNASQSEWTVPPLITVGIGWLF